MSQIRPSGHLKDPREWDKESLVTFILASEGEPFGAFGMKSMLENMPKERLVPWVNSLLKQREKRDNS